VAADERARKLRGMASTTAERVWSDAGPPSSVRDPVSYGGTEIADLHRERAAAGERSEAAAELAEFLEGGLRPHSCSSCGTRVLVKKNSHKHTSIQWTTDAASSCPVFRERSAAGTDTALLDTCERLKASISASARNGDFGALDE
jgi:hypothetical protein